MYRICYSLHYDKWPAEKEWLNLQKIYPSHEESWDWEREIPIVQVGVIVDNEIGLLLGLRHTIDYKELYLQGS